MLLTLFFSKKIWTRERKNLWLSIAFRTQQAAAKEDLCVAEIPVSRIRQILLFLKERFSFLSKNAEKCEYAYRVKKRFCVAKARGETRFVLNVLSF